MQTIPLPQKLIAAMTACDQEKAALLRGWALSLDVTNLAGFTLATDYSHLTKKEESDAPPTP